MKTVILGAVFDLTFEQIYPFVKTLERAKYSGEVVLFCRGISKITKDSVSRFGNYQFVDIPQSDMHINNFRFFQYLKFLRGNSYDAVMLSDIRDVAFQTDPFKFELGDNLVAVLEEQYCLGSCPVNGPWFRACYSSKVVDKLYHARISCAGTIYGSYEKMAVHVEKICKELEFIRKSKGKIVGGVGPDQIAHNCVIYLGDMKEIVFQDNVSGPVLTCARVFEDRVKYDSRGRIINDAGVVNVIHQYDRHGSLVEHVDRLINA